MTNGDSQWEKGYFYSFIVLLLGSFLLYCLLLFPYDLYSLEVVFIDLNLPIFCIEILVLLTVHLFFLSRYIRFKYHKTTSKICYCYLISLLITSATYYLLYHRIFGLLINIFGKMLNRGKFLNGDVLIFCLFLLINTINIFHITAHPKKIFSYIGLFTSYILLFSSLIIIGDFGNKFKYYSLSVSSDVEFEFIPLISSFVLPCGLFFRAWLVATHIFIRFCQMRQCYGIKLRNYQKALLLPGVSATLVFIVASLLAAMYRCSVLSLEEQLKQSCSLLYYRHNQKDFDYEKLQKYKVEMEQKEHSTRRELTQHINNKEKDKIIAGYITYCQTIFLLIDYDLWINPCRSHSHLRDLRNILIGIIPLLNSSEQKELVSPTANVLNKYIGKYEISEDIESFYIMAEYKDLKDAINSLVPDDKAFQIFCAPLYISVLRTQIKVLQPSQKESFQGLCQHYADELFNTMSQITSGDGQ